MGRLLDIARAQPAKRVKRVKSPEPQSTTRVRKKGEKGEKPQLTDPFHPLNPFRAGACTDCGVIGAALDSDHGRCTRCYVAARRAQKLPVGTAPGPSIERQPEPTGAIPVPSGCDICGKVRPIMLVGDDGARACSACARAGEGARRRAGHRQGCGCSACMPDHPIHNPHKEDTHGPR